MGADRRDNKMVSNAQFDIEKFDLVREAVAAERRIRKYVDEFALVTEDEIKDALLWFLDSHHLLIEGSAAVPIAVFMRMKEQFKGKTVVILLCGSNITLETLRSIL